MCDDLVLNRKSNKIKKKLIMFLFHFYECRCQGKKNYCSVWAEDLVLGKPCVEFSHKYLEITYECLEGKELNCFSYLMCFYSKEKK